MLEHIAKIEEVVATFEVLAPNFPRGKVFFRVIARKKSYVAFPNVAVKKKDKTPEWISGLGKTIEDALADGIQIFFQTIEKYGAQEEKDFEWSSFSDF